MDAADWAIAGIAVLSLGVAVWSVLDGRASARRAWREAKRSADAHVESVALQRKEAEKPGWRIDPLKGSMCQLVNDSAATEFGVKIEREPPGRLDFEQPTDVIGPGSSVAFFATGDFTMRVTSHRHPDLTDAPRTWTHPMKA